MSTPSPKRRPQSYDEFNEHPHDNNNDINHPQQPQNNELNIDTTNNVEYSTLVLRSSPPKKNCCTRPVAAAFLLLVASALIAAWQLLPAEEIAKSYIPKFDAPKNPYTGIEAGAPGGEAFNASDNGGILMGDFDINIPGVDFGGDDDGDDDSSSALTVPSFMQCPSNNNLCCNGSNSNCVLRVDQMMFSMVHNANAAEEGGFFAGYNHFNSLEKALIAGHRGINLDVCNCGGQLQFCHNVCDLGERYPNEVFGNMMEFLNEYPSEVIILLFEASEQGTINWNELYGEMQTVDGFVDKLYTHTLGEEWPTMRQLVRNDKRIITFYFNGGECDNGSCPAPFHRWFNYAAETQYQSSSISDLNDYEYSCQVTRGPGSSSDERVSNADFFVVNNFVTPPDPDAAATANSKDFIAGRLSQCANYNNKRPNFVYVDFWSEGVAAELVQYANGQMANEIRT